MNKNFLVSLFVLICISIGLGQSPRFGYRRKLLPSSKEGWYAVTLPQDIFKHIKSDYSDLRLYQLNGTDTLEIPYLIRIKNDEISEGVISLPVLNKSMKDGKLFLTFQLNRDQSVNYLDLHFEEKNFNASVKFEGSNDQKEWFELVNRQRILSIQNNDIDFSVSTLHFPLTNYKFLRASITSDKPLTFKDATFRSKEVKAGSFTDIKTTHKITSDKKTKQTVAEVSFNEYQSVSRLSVQVNHQGDYYRSFSLEALRDSSQSPNQQWQYYYEPVFNGYLTSIEPNEFEFNLISSNRLRIIVFNADNAPLNIEGFKVTAPQIDLVAQLKPGENFLFYNNSSLYPPSYDLVHFEDQVPDSLSFIQSGKEEKLTPEKEKVSPLMENKLWLWVVLGAIIGLLGFGTLRMMSKK
jgi:hypothetical protein